MPNSYTTGTVSVTNGSATVTGSGTAFSLNAVVGGFLQVDDDTRQYEIIAAPSATSITLDKPYAGTTGSGKTYRIFLTSAQAASNITINRQLGEIIARLVDSAPEIQDFLDAATLGDAQTALGISAFIKTLLDDADAAAARATLGANNASNLNSGTLPNGVFPSGSKAAMSSSFITDWRAVTASGKYASLPSASSNAPNAGSVWLGEVEYYSPDWIVIEVWPLGSGMRSATRWRCERHSGTTWSAWEPVQANQIVNDGRYPRKPQGAAGAGQWVQFNTAADGSYTLPSGGTWAYFAASLVNATGGVSGVASAVAAGGTLIAPIITGYRWAGFAWRISE